MITFRITYTVPDEDEAEGSCNVKCEGAEGRELMSAHEWGHLMARVGFTLGDYYEKCLRSSNTSEAEIALAKRQMIEGGRCEVANPTTYDKPRGRHH